jgi:hypothetical protein
MTEPIDARAYVVVPFQYPGAERPHIFAVYERCYPGLPRLVCWTANPARYAESADFVGAVIELPEEPEIEGAPSVDIAA